MTSSARLRHRHTVLAAIAIIFAVAMTIGSARAKAAPMTPALPAATTSASSAQALFALANADRAQAGLPPLQWRDDIASIATGWSAQMADSGVLSHNDDYFSSSTRAMLGTSAEGENVASIGSVEAANYAFMQSDHHRANILDPRFNVGGFGAAQDSRGFWWYTEDFAQTSGAPAAAPVADDPPADPPAEAPAADPAPAPEVTPVAAAAPVPTVVDTTAPPATDPTTTAAPAPESTPVASVENSLDLTDHSAAASHARTEAAWYVFWLGALLFIGLDAFALAWVKRRFNTAR